MNIVFQKSQDQDKRKLGGDGRFDSPGWCAKFCTYVIQVSLIKYPMSVHCALCMLVLLTPS